MSTADAMLMHLRRQEQVVCSRLGAGVDIEQAMHRARWEKELAHDLGMTVADTKWFVGALAANLRTAVRGVETKIERVQAAHVVYGSYRERMMPAGAATPERCCPQLAPEGTHLVYLLYSQAGALLYVGITDRGPVRLVEHYRRKPWFGQVARVEFERYGSRADSELREKTLIRKRAPLHNVQHNGGRFPVAAAS